MKMARVSVPYLDLPLVSLGLAPGSVVMSACQTQAPPGLRGEDHCVWSQATQLVVRAVKFPCGQGFGPWAAMIVEPGLPSTVDRVAIVFDGNTLRIEVKDESANRNLVILVNKAFTDQHRDSAETNLNIRTSDAVNYDGLRGAPIAMPGGVGGPF